MLTVSSFESNLNLDFSFELAKKLWRRRILTSWRGARLLRLEWSEPTDGQKPAWRQFIRRLTSADAKRASASLLRSPIRRIFKVDDDVDVGGNKTTFSWSTLHSEIFYDSRSLSHTRSHSFVLSLCLTHTHTLPLSLPKSGISNKGMFEALNAFLNPFKNVTNALFATYATIDGDGWTVNSSLTSSFKAASKITVDGLNLLIRFLSRTSSWNATRLFYATFHRQSN